MSGITLDDLQNGYRIYQYQKGFRFGMDAVLLSGYAEVRRKERVLDLGSGTGIIPILLAAKTESSGIEGIELLESNVSLAQKSIAYNSLKDRVRIIQGDLRRIRDYYGEASFDAVTGNPPYLPAGHGFIAPDEEKAAARHELFCTIDDVARAASFVLKTGGRFYMVHRPERLADIFRAFDKAALEIKKMRLVCPNAQKEPNLVLIEAHKGAAPGIRMERPLIVYREDGSYTEEALKFYGMP